jgi:tetratricopeptide (TPR) repeat protein
LLERTLEMRKRLLGEEHPDTSVSMNNLGRLYRTLGKYDLTEALYRKTLEIRRRVFGEEHQSTAIAMNNLGFLYYSQGKYKEAEPLYARSLEIRRRLMGEHHPNTATARANVGLLYFVQGRYAEAEPLLVQALESRNNGFGDAHGDTLNSMTQLALCYIKQAKWDAADALLSKVAEIRTRLRNPLAAEAKMLQADIRIQRRMYGEAGTLLHEACSPGTSWTAFYCQGLRGAVLAGNRSFQEAEPLLLEGYDGLVQQKSKMPPERMQHVREAAERIVRLYEEWQKPELALEWKQKLR